MSKAKDILSKIQRPSLEMENEVVEIPIEQVPIHPMLVTGREYKDPRPDLEEDSNLWCQAFIQAEKFSLQLAKNLWELRNWGTRIKRGQKGFVIRPDIDEEGIRAWPNEEMYRKHSARLLGPFRGQVKEILRGLFEWEDSHAG